MFFFELGDSTHEFGKMDEEYEWLRFKEDSPLVGSQSDMSEKRRERRERRLQVLYLGTVELLICGSCAVTAAAMYQRNGSKPDTYFTKFPRCILVMNLCESK